MLFYFLGNVPRPDCSGCGGTGYSTTIIIIFITIPVALGASICCYKKKTQRNRSSTSVGHQTVTVNRNIGYRSQSAPPAYQEALSDTTQRETISPDDEGTQETQFIPQQSPPPAYTSTPPPPQGTGLRTEEPPPYSAAHTVQYPYTTATGVYPYTSSQEEY